MTDVLDDILNTLKLAGVLYFRTDFSQDWATTVPDLSGAARFHVVMRGECHVSLSTGERVKLEAGDVAFVPRGASHVISSRPQETAPPLETVMRAAGYEGEGVLVVGAGDPEASTRMVCGHYSFRAGADHPILQALPNLVHLKAEDRRRRPLADNILNLISAHLFSDGLGAETAIRKLSECLYVEILSVATERDPDFARRASAFRDRHVGPALSRLHRDPARDWSLNSLAGEAGMSRSRFADRFRELLGVGPMTYLANWRIQVALCLLDDTDLSVKEISAAAGYASPSAFARAFAGKIGVPPSDYRRGRRGDADRRE